MAKLIDRRKQAMGGQSQRQVSQITHIAIHYSATATGNSAAFENYWKNSRAWTTGGYHEVVLLNGDVEINYSPTVMTNGIAGHNRSTYHICYVGDGKANPAQLQTLRERVKIARSAYKVELSQIKGHRQFSGARTSCPALDVEKEIVQGLGTSWLQDIIHLIKPVAKPVLTGRTAQIQTWLNRYSFNQIQVDDRYGPRTHQALIKVYQYELNKQFKKKLVLDGIPGPKTDAAAVLVRKGAKGNLTKVLQACLFFKDYRLAVDGIFGELTEEMVRLFQASQALSVDGKVGSQTWKRLIRP